MRGITCGRLGYLKKKASNPSFSFVCGFRCCFCGGFVVNSRGEGFLDVCVLGCFFGLGFDLGLG